LDKVGRDAGSGIRRRHRPPHPRQRAEIVAGREFEIVSDRFSAGPFLGGAVAFKAKAHAQSTKRPVRIQTSKN